MVLADKWEKNKEISLSIYGDLGGDKDGKRNYLKK